MGNVAGILGSRADDAHLALEDVDELWQFIQGGLAQEAADPSESRIIWGIEAEAVGIADVGGIHDHGAELVAGEGLAVLAHPGLAEEG